MSQRAWALFLRRDLAVALDAQASVASPSARTSGQEQRETMASATATIQLHIADGRGFCRGCLDLYARLSWAPCPQAQRAQGYIGEVGTLEAKEKTAAGPVAVA